MRRPNLLLCFDAFGTLFRPKQRIAQQYCEVARQHGIVGFSDDELQSSFSAAFKDEAKRNPNYGKATGLGATRWWTNVIHKTFTPLIRSDQVLPKDLTTKLLDRFSSSEGYDTESNLVPLLKALRHPSSHNLFDSLVVGVVTNSDDRVPSILSSLGMNVSPLRYGTEGDLNAVAGQKYDIDFHCMSYDVGVEKPDRIIFNAAELMLEQVITNRDGKSPPGIKADINTWRKVYVGDEYAKDVVGAADAGWNPVLLDSSEHSANIPKLEDYPTDTLDDLFKAHAVVRVNSIQDLVTWLTGGRSTTT